MATTTSNLPTQNLLLINAVCSGNVELAVQLLSTCTALEPDKNGYTLLHYGAVSGHARIVQCLIERGFRVDPKDNLGYTPLHLAASHGHLDVVQVLLTVSRSVNSQDRVHGNTAVHEAAWNGFSQTLHELVTAKANVNAINSAGFSALHLAAQTGHNESARILLFAGCSPDHKNSYGDTPLHTAARYGHAGVTQILISAKCSINEVNKNGDTALHIAAAQKQKKITKLLLDAGVDVLSLNCQNETALDIARRKDYEELVSLISRVQISSPKRQSRSSASDLGKTTPPVTNVSAEKKKWTSIFKKNKSKEKLPSGKMDAVCIEEMAPSMTGTMDSARGFHGNMYRDFQYYAMMKQQHRMAQEAGGFVPEAMTSAPPGVDAGVVRGILSRYTPQQGVQYYRDLAGNIKQGPVGYVASSDNRDTASQFNVPPAGQYNMPPASQICYNNPHIAGSHYPSASFRTGPGYGTMQADHVRQRDHLSYLRNRHAVTGYCGQPGLLPVGASLPRPVYPTYLDQTGRPWPAMYPGLSAVQPVGMPPHPVVPMNNGGDFDAQSEMSVPVNGSRPIYRSRSDETLSTVSSRPSFQRHHVRPVESKKTRHRKRNEQRLQVLNEKLAAAAAAAENPDIQRVVDSSTKDRNDVAADSVIPPAYVDSSSNPDSGYSGASMTVAAVPPPPRRRPPAPRSESSSIISGSSGDVIGGGGSSSGGKAGTLGSSCKSDSVISICNSL